MKKKLILIPEGGLCNRIRTVNSAYELFQGKRDITVIWLKKAGLIAKSKDIFTIPSDIKIIEVDFDSDVQYFLYRLIRKVCSAIKLWIMFEDVVSRGEDYISRLFRRRTIVCESFYEFFNKRGKNIFEPNEDIVARADEIISMHRDYIGVHIRRTDHKSAIADSPVEEFDKIINKEVAQDKMIYLSTDDKEVRDYFVNKYSDNIFYQETEELTRESLEGIKAAYVDILCLSKAKKIYGSCYSSFSEYAAYIGGITLEVVKK